MFLTIAAMWVFFGPVTLEKAYGICQGEITKECYKEALQPITPVDYSKLNG